MLAIYQRSWLFFCCLQPRKGALFLSPPLQSTTPKHSGQFHVEKRSKVAL